MVKRTSNRNGGGTNPSPAATIYRGPLRTKVADGDNATITTMVTLTGPAPTSATGLFSGVAKTSDVTAASEWSTWINLFQEYRILAMEWEFDPLYHDGVVTDGTIVPAQGAVACYHQTGYSLPTSVAELVNNRTFKPLNLAKPVKCHWKMSGPDEATFQPTTTSVEYGGITFYADGGTTSTNFGRLYIRYLVQFKGRK